MRMQFLIQQRRLYWLKVAADILFVVGAGCFLVWAGVLSEGALYQKAQREHFQAAQPAPPAPNGAALRPVEAVPARVSLGTPKLLDLFPPDRNIVGRLEIPSIGLDVMVRDGVDAATLRKAVGRLPSSAEPGMPGNLVLLGHRDTYFRPLRNLAQGDQIQIQGWGGKYSYEVESIVVVPPEAALDLPAVSDSWITLVTCFPFDYAGPAPKRYVARARLEQDGPHSE